MVQIERLRAMARQAVMEYQAALAAGGEPSYPQWADDILVVCEHAETGQHYPEVMSARIIPLHGERRATM